MRRTTRWPPWQSSLRFLLLLTTLIAVGAAFVGWRAARLEPQRRAAVRIVESGGSVEIEQRGWLDAALPVHVLRRVHTRADRLRNRGARGGKPQFGQCAGAPRALMATNWGSRMNQGSHRQ